MRKSPPEPSHPGLFKQVGGDETMEWNGSAGSGSGKGEVTRWNLNTKHTRPGKNTRHNNKFINNALRHCTYQIGRAHV